MTAVPTEHLRIGQVFHEDDDFITLKIAKDLSTEIVLGEADEPDAFYTIIFLKREEDGAARTWLPWEED